jgi:hypothetical protein
MNNKNTEKDKEILNLNQKLDVLTDKLVLCN